MKNLMIEVLKNPKPSVYYDLKGYVLSHQIPLFYQEQSTPQIEDMEGYVNIPYFSHEILKRPETSRLSTPEPVSHLIGNSVDLCRQVLEHNDIPLHYFLRICINVVNPFKDVLKSLPHTDHDFYHKNLIIYFTPAGGRTFVGDESFDPSEDSIVTFGGEQHYYESPKSERRVVLIATYV
jgi:hypothetical protein